MSRVFLCPVFGRTCRAEAARGSRFAAARAAGPPAEDGWRDLVERLIGHATTLQEREESFRQDIQLLVAALGLRSLVPEQAGALDLPKLLAKYERALVVWALAASRGCQKRAAPLLGIGPTTLNEKMKRLRIARNGAA